MTFWQKIKPWLGLTALFVVGMLCGALVMGGFLKRKAMRGDLPTFLLGAAADPARQEGKASGRPPRNTAPLSDPNRWAKFSLQRLNKRLSLTEDQRAKIEPLLQKSAGDIRDVQMKTRERILQIISSNREEVSKFLTPEQQGEFEKIQQEQAKRFQFSPPGPGMGERSRDALDVPRPKPNTP